MEPLTKIGLPLTLLPCESCRMEPGSGRSPAYTPFHIALVDVPVESDLDPLTVPVDVQRIQWTRTEPGRYSASATVLVPCPCCQNLREMQYHLEAPLILLTTLQKCRRCQGPLEIEGEEIDYRDQGNGSFLVDVSVTLFCRSCLTVEPKSARVSVPEWTQFRAFNDINVGLPTSGVTQEPGIFISYRRADSHDVTGRIFDRLASRFGGDLVMRDVNSVPVGSNFMRFLADGLRACRVMLVVIGPRWASIADATGARRLDDPADLVRVEIEAALERGIPVIPLFVTGASMPRSHELPDSLKPLSNQQGLPVRPDPDFDSDIQRLFAVLDKLVVQRSA